MPLPTFRSTRARQKDTQGERPPTQDGKTKERVGEDSTSEEILILSTKYKPGANVKGATRTRKTYIIISSILHFISVIFLILIMIGNINSKPVIKASYFFKLDLSNVYPQAFGSTNLVFVNSIARSIGLHDFYQVGLWSYCEGYNDEGINACTTPSLTYYFNPVSIILSELLSGATISLPTDIISLLSLIQLFSRLMSSFFIASLVLSTVAIPLCYLPMYSRWYSLGVSIFTFITALLTAAAAIIGTVMFSIFRNVLTSQPGLNIGAQLGTQMMAFVWISAGCSMLAWAVQAALGCCCASRRDVKTGRRMGKKSAYGDGVGRENYFSNEKGKKNAGRRIWLGGSRIR